MSNIVEVKTKKDLSNVSSGFTGYNGVVKLDTTDERVYAFNNAEMIVDSVYKREREGAISLIRSEALMIEKKSIMGDLWNSNKAHIPDEFSVKWDKFTEKLDNASGDRIRALLVFADYHETSKFAGVKYTAPNQGQFNTLAKLVNKQTGKKDLTPVVKMYDVLVKKNSNKHFKSAIDLEDAYLKFTTVLPSKDEVIESDEEIEEEQADVYLPHIFAEEVGTEPVVELNSMTLPNTMISKLVNVSKDEWKQFYRESAKIFHSDKGGDGFEILNGLNQMMKVYYKNQSEIEDKEIYNDDYKRWMEDHGFESDFVTAKEFEEKKG